MITSADGAVAIDGVSGGLGGSSDRSVFRHLRSIADGVLVGAETVRRERYSPIPPHQTLAIVSRSGDLGDTGADLIAAANTIVVDGDVREICSRLTGNVWILEGGPTLNAQMFAADCVDEVCLTISPRFISGEVGRIVGAGKPLDTSWALAHIAHEDDFVFLRYLRDRST